MMINSIHENKFIHSITKIRGHIANIVNIQIAVEVK